MKQKLETTLHRIDDNVKNQETLLVASVNQCISAMIRDVGIMTDNVDVYYDSSLLTSSISRKPASGSFVVAASYDIENILQVAVECIGIIDTHNNGK